MRYGQALYGSGPDRDRGFRRNARASISEGPALPQARRGEQPLNGSAVSARSGITQEDCYFLTALAPAE